MPKVTVEYDLPREQEELEALFLGRESVNALREMASWLEAKLVESPHGPPQSPAAFYRQALSECLTQLHSLGRPQQTPEEPDE